MELIKLFSSRGKGRPLSNCIVIERIENLDLMIGRKVYASWDTHYKALSLYPGWDEKDEILECVQSFIDRHTNESYYSLAYIKFMIERGDIEELPF